jgi:hypothetical protein
MNSSRVSLILIPLLLSNCASNYQYKGSDGAAYLHIAGNTEDFFVEAYDDANCALSKNGTRLANFFGPTKNVADHEAGTTVPVSSGKPFIFTYYYIDARFAQNRKCSLTVSFLPESGKSYNSYFYVDPEVTRCDATIYSPNDKPGNNVSSFAYNPNRCINGRNDGPRNGQATWINWSVVFSRIPHAGGGVTVTHH